MGLNVEQLEAMYGEPGEASVIKVADHVTPLYRTWIERSRFCVLSTVGPEGTDASPRGDDGPVVRVHSSQQLWLPDWRGNARIDSLRNVARDGRVSLMFFVPGSLNVVRVNGRGEVVDDPNVTGVFDRAGVCPRTVVVVTVREVYSQCGRAIKRAGLWGGADESVGLPTVGALLAEQKAGFDADTYDAEWAGRAARTMW